MPSQLPPLPCEQALIENLPTTLRSERALVISPGRGQTAVHVAATVPECRPTVWYADLHRARLAQEAIGEHDLPIDVACNADLPDALFDLAAVAVLARDEAEWTRDILQQAHQRLDMHGQLIASVDNPRDRWLGEQMRSMFDKVTCHDTDKARIYSARKTHQLKKVRDFGCEFVFRDEERLIHAFSRPGVFSHRKLDAGARQLLRIVDVAAGERVLDLGCGSGAVGIAAALRAPDVKVFAVDSHARAVECTRRGADFNGVTDLETIWNADGQFQLDAPVDIVLANPPYYGDFSIAEHFLSVARRVLRPGGAALFVSKSPTWYAQSMSCCMKDVELIESGKYYVACGRK